MSEEQAIYGVVRPENIPFALSIADLAQICHEANRALSTTQADIHLPWDMAAQWQKDSAVNGVRFVLMNPNEGPEATHINWMKTKEADGWKYGPVKDVEKKEHPCMRPWDELSEFQKAKDVLFRSIVRSLGAFIVWPE